MGTHLPTMCDLGTTPSTTIKKQSNKYTGRREGRQASFSSLADCILKNHPKPPAFMMLLGALRHFFERISYGTVCRIFPHCPVCGGDFKSVLPPFLRATDQLYSSPNDFCSQCSQGQPLCDSQNPQRLPVTTAAFKCP